MGKKLRGGEREDQEAGDKGKCFHEVVADLVLVTVVKCRNNDRYGGGMLLL